MKVAVPSGAKALTVSVVFAGNTTMSKASAKVTRSRSANHSDLRTDCARRGGHGPPVVSVASPARTGSRASVIGTLNGMGWMTGNGPLSKQPAGHFNFEPPSPGRTIYLEPTPKRIRVEVGGEVIADSRRAFILHESGLQPAYYFRRGCARRRAGADRPSHALPQEGRTPPTTRSRPAGDGGERCVYYPAPLDDAPFIKDLVAFYFDRMGRWLEEGEEIGVHPRDPYHRVDVVSTDRHIRVSLDGSCWRRPTGRWPCSNPTCRRAGTCPVTTWSRRWSAPTR